MKKLFTLRSLFSLVLLLIAVDALISGIKTSVQEVQDASFFAVAAFSVTLSYAFGFSRWSARRVWLLVLTYAFMLAFMESARAMSPVKTIILSLPVLNLDLIRWVFLKEAPDLSIFQTQFNALGESTGAFISLLFSASVQNPQVREFLWDMPLLLLCTWTGWRTSRRNQILIAIAPSLAFHAFILNYTGKETISLQIAVFALILLIGINQKWSSSTQKTENSERAERETYSAVILLSIGVAIIAGMTPSFSIREVAQKLTAKDEAAKSIGLEREIVQAYAISGLPRQHLIGLSPAVSQEVIFKVKTGEIAASENAILGEAVPAHYWRWLTYDIYTGHGWATSPVENNSYPSNEALIPFPNQRYRVIHQQVEKALPDDNRLYWTGSLISAAQPISASWRTKPQSLSSSADPTFGADLLGAVTEEHTYQADSFIPIVSADQLRESSQVYPAEIQSRYTALPETVPPRVSELARNITAADTNPYDKAKSIEAYLRQFPYTLNIPPPPPDQDLADYFLFDLQKGYCDYYATAMVVMARSIGLPARLVIGYANGIYDPNKAEYVVHEAEAHSWVEIYFTGMGWIEFEPTASQLLISLPDELPKVEVRTHSTASAYAKKSFFPQKEPFTIGISLALVFILLFSFLWFFRTQGLLRAHNTVGSIYEYIYYHGRKIYKDAPLHETPSIFGEQLTRRIRTRLPRMVPAGDEIRLLTDLYIQETYSAHPLSRDERAGAVKVWRKLFWRLLYARFRGL